VPACDERVEHDEAQHEHGQRPQRVRSAADERQLLEDRDHDHDDRDPARRALLAPARRRAKDPGRFTAPCPGALR
jgi:hypothetical protein